MRVPVRALVVGACLSLAAVDAYAQTALTLPDVVARARAEAPLIVGARLAADEASGRLTGASLRLQANPELEFGLGRRTGPGGPYTDFDLGITQWFDRPGHRQARLQGAYAAVDRSAAVVDETTRTVLRDAVFAFYEAVHADERIRLLADAEDLAARVYDVAERRFRAGDLAILDVNTARASLARARAEREAAEAVRISALGTLRAILDIQEAIVVNGSLQAGTPIDLEALARSAAERPELRALDAEIREAEADVQLAGALARPEYGVGVQFRNEGLDRILFGGVAVSLPLFSSGQELRATGNARAARLRAARDAARARVQIELRTAADVHARRANAVRLLEQDVLPGLDENETLATRSFEAGQIGLPELLLFHRDILDARLQHVDAQLEAVLARVDIDAVAGVLR